MRRPFFFVKIHSVSFINNGSVEISGRVKVFYLLKKPMNGEFDKLPYQADFTICLETNSKHKTQGSF